MTWLAGALMEDTDVCPKVNTFQQDEDVSPGSLLSCDFATQGWSQTPSWQLEGHHPLVGTAFETQLSCCFLADMSSLLLSPKKISHY